MEDMVIRQPMRIITACQVDKVRFNEAEIMLHLLDKFSSINDHLHLQPVTSQVSQLVNG